MDTTSLFKCPGLDAKAENITRTYQSGAEHTLALRQVSCILAQGQITVIQGPSGCGKSTLLNILGGVDRPDAGAVHIGSRVLDPTVPERELAEFRLRGVGFVFQAFNLIPGLTALENLQLPMTVAGFKRADQIERGTRLLELVGLGDKGSKRPDALSGGEQQRIAIALALVNDPPLILADEPTGNLDAGNTLRVISLLRALASDHGKTVVVTTHDPLVARQGDRVLHMRDGQFDGKS